MNQETPIATAPVAQNNEIGDVYFPKLIANGLECWKSRITAIEIQEKGIKFRREHPMHNNETFFLSHDALATSHWEKSKIKY